MNGGVVPMPATKRVRIGQNAVTVMGSSGGGSGGGGVSSNVMMAGRTPGVRSNAMAATPMTTGTQQDATPNALADACAGAAALVAAAGGGGGGPAKTVRIGGTTSFASPPAAAIFKNTF